MKIIFTLFILLTTMLTVQATQLESITKTIAFSAANLKAVTKHNIHKYCRNQINITPMKYEKTKELVLFGTDMCISHWKHKKGLK